MKDAFEVMPRATAELYLRLQDEPLLQSLILIGGTALALHLGHRVSEDLDYLCPALKLPKEKLKALLLKLRGEGHTITDSDPVESLIEFEVAGMDLHDYSRTLKIDDAVSVTFFVADQQQERVLEPPPTEFIGPRVASLAELCALKALVARSRSTSRDWLDLYLLERDHGFSLADWRRTYDKAGLRHWDFEHALRRICSGQVSQSDVKFESLLPNAPSIEEIAAHFRKLRAEYEVAQSRDEL